MSPRRNWPLFGKLSEDLRTVVPDAGQRVACPVCLGFFDADDYRSGQLTRGHIIPEATGGKSYTLVCRACNSKLGSDQDAELKKLSDYVRMTRGPGLPRGTKRRVPITMSEQKLDADLILGNGATDVGMTIAVSRANAPERLQEVRRTLGAKRDRLSVSLHFPMNIRMAEVGILTAAYLEAFRLFGYWFILNSNLDIVREQILNARADVLNETACMEWPPQPEISLRAFLVIEPDSLQCVAFRFLNRTVVLPMAEDRDASIYSKMGVYIRNKDKLGLAWPPTMRVVEIATGWRSRPVVARKEGDERPITYAHPDAGAVARMSAVPVAELPWIEDAPIWARSA